MVNIYLRKYITRHVTYGILDIKVENVGEFSDRRNNKTAKSFPFYHRISLLYFCFG